MKVLSFSLFNNESLIWRVKQQEESSFVDEFHITEADMNFRYQPKPLLLKNETKSVTVHKLQGKKHFEGPKYQVSRKPLKISRTVNPWANEAVQRNHAIKHCNFADDDILIFSDIDEILSAEIFPELILETLKRGIITVKLHFTLYFFNLFALNWPGPPNYSYRTFLMTGAQYRKLNLTVDQLRKLGESGKLDDSVYCFPEFAGFHHSWLGDEKFVMSKLNSYSHSSQDHSSFFYKNGKPELKLIKKAIHDKQSLFGDEYLLGPKPEVKLLNSVEGLRKSPLYSSFFVED